MVRDLSSQPASVRSPIQGGSRSAVAVVFLFTLYPTQGLLMIQSFDRRTGIVLDRAAMTDEARALMLDFLNGTG